KRGDVDVVIATLTATRRRAREIDFSLPYFQDQQGLLVKAGSPIQSYRDLAGKKVAAIAGTTSIDNVKVVAPDAQTVPVQSLFEAFEKLRADTADAMTSDSLQLQATRLAAAEPAQYRIAGEGFSVEPYVIGLPQNDSQFRVRVDEFLTELWNSGAWTRLFNKWLGAQSPYNLEAHFQMPVLPP
ncbi:MAG: transporter substrate-binding domain-containing protein, partial [Planctomycetota bacterium]|nr:transporter substrate-binding domain-containing protein [Planctomycetota bacterium]